MLDCWTGLDFLKILQDFRESVPDIVTYFLMAISSIVFYMIVPLLLFFVMYWFMDKKKGELCMVNVISAYMIANFLKFMIKEPRPYELDPEIHPATTETSYSTPSAHSAIATAGYGSIIAVVKNNWLRITLFVIMVLIIFSRLYLGVHTPLDVILGVMVALAVMAANYYLMTKSWESDRNYYTIGIGYVAFFAIILTLTFVNMDNDFKNISLGAGLLMGLLVARLIEHRYIGYETVQTTTKNKVILGSIGLLVMAVIIGIPYVIGIPVLMFVSGFVALIWSYDVYPYLMKKKASFLSRYV